jgi:hypothetical protein
MTDRVIQPLAVNPWRSLDGVLDDYLKWRDQHVSDQMGALAPLLDHWIEVRTEIAASNRAHGGNFNPLVKLKIDETRHSRILGDFLNPEGSHGQGNLFLLPFLKDLGIPEPDVGLWRVTVEIGRIDILIWRNEPRKSAVIIENKSNGAGDQMNQIYRYWHQEMYLWDRSLWETTNEAAIAERSRNFHIVYLPTGDDKAPAPHSKQRPAGFEKVNPFPAVPLEWTIRPLAKLMEIWALHSEPGIPPNNHRLRSFFSQYKELWTR